MTNVIAGMEVSRVRRLLHALEHTANDLAGSLASLTDGLGGLDGAADHTRRDASALAADDERIRELLASLAAEVMASERARGPMRSRGAERPASVAPRPEGHGP